MTFRKFRIPRTRNRVLSAAAGGFALCLAAACGSGGTGSGAAAPNGSPSVSATVLAGGSCESSKATKITFWAWVPGINRAVEEFNKTHPAICVTLESPGAGDQEYTPLSNALKAGSGAPDVAEVEFAELPSFEVLHYVVDLSKYGASAYRTKFVPWAWSQVARGPSVYAMPSDFGPMGYFYNSELLAKHHITPPATWAELAASAARLHKADPNAYLLNFSPDDLQRLMALMGQAGAWPFGYTGGDAVTINWTGPAQLRFAAYWQNLINQHVVTTVTTVNSNPVPNANLDRGVVVSDLDAAWTPSYFAPTAKRTLGKWRAAPLPQWTPGANVGADWGGSTYPVFTQSKHPAEAAQFVEWLCGSDAAWRILKTPPSSLFPTYAPLLDHPSFESLTYPISGTSHPNQVFAEAAGHITPAQWPPFMTQALSQAQTTFGAVLHGKQTMQQAFQTFQKQEVSYARAQGFKVSGGG